MGMFFSKNSNATEYEDKFSRSLRIEGQMAVADLEVDFRSFREVVDKKPTFTVQARLDFSGVSDSQMFHWAAFTKMVDLHDAILNCTARFLNNLFKQGPVCCPASTAETMFIEPEVKHSIFEVSRDARKLIEGNKFSIYDEELFNEIFFGLCTEEGKVAVIDFAIHKNRYQNLGNNYDEVLDSQIRLDFSEVSDTQMLLWAARTKMIDLQRALYRSGMSDKQFLNDLVKQGCPVCRHASEAGLPFDDTTRKQQHVMTSVQDMSAEDRAQLIKLLQQMDK